MIFGMTNEDRAKSQIWFAWRPVQLIDGRWIWLQKVIKTRRLCYTDYALIGDKHE